MVKRSIFLLIILMVVGLAATILQLSGASNSSDLRRNLTTQWYSMYFTETPTPYPSLLSFKRNSPTHTMLPTLQAKIRSVLSPKLTTGAQSPPNLLKSSKLPPNLSTATPVSISTIEPDFSICSPLRAHGFNLLNQIISDPYHPPPMGRDDRHQGVDFSYHRWRGKTSILGVGVQSVLAGRVAAAIWDSFPYGNLIIIETPYDSLPNNLIAELNIPAGESIYSLYAHLGEDIQVITGDQVRSCQFLGSVGKSGNTLVAHLHLETRTGPPGITFAGISDFVEQATPEDEQNYLLWRTSGVFQHFDPMELVLFKIEK